MKLITETTQSKSKIILINLLEEMGYKDIKTFQQENNLIVDGLFGINSYNALYNIILNPQPVLFDNYYYKQAHPKKQIILHHSAGWDNARGMFNWWMNDGVSHVATSIGISDDGKLYKGFDEQYWAFSIGCKTQTFINNGVQLKYRNGRIINNQQLDEQAVAVEICNWGTLTKKNDKYYSWANAEVFPSKVIELNYKNQKYFEIYTDEEIETTKNWILLNSIRFDIPIDYSYDDMFSVSKKALSGEAGIFTHNSYRLDKSDISPQPKMLDMLKNLIHYTK
jgi:hypothetical protein